LQEEEALVLLREQPLEGEFDALRVAFAQIEICQGDQPPQRRVDATQVPEVGLALLQVDELRDLPIRGLVPGQRVQAGRRRALQLLITGHSHAERAHRRIPPEDRCIPACRGALARGRGQNSAG
jgi:hypothetical protein